MPQLRKDANMADSVAPEIRSKIMSRIRSKGCRPEMAARKGLFARGLRYRLHDKRLPGKPDMVFPRYRAVVFVHGCFWHGHEGRPCFRMPSSRLDYWQRKIEGNRARDRKAIAELRAMGWKVCVVWECELKADPKGALDKLYRQITGREAPGD